jgi:hypothetical protein
MNNPPAFPYSFPDGKQDEYTVAYGMTLRDYFAAKAMPTLATQFYSLNQQLSKGTVPELVSEVAYQFADAMLRAREEV